MSLEIFHYHITFILSALAELSLGVSKGTMEVLTSCHQNTNNMHSYICLSKEGRTFWHSLQKISHSLKWNPRHTDVF